MRVNKSAIVLVGALLKAAYNVNYLWGSEEKQKVIREQWPEMRIRLDELSEALDELHPLSLEEALTEIRTDDTQFEASSAADWLWEEVLAGRLKLTIESRKP
jgi:hypothetical protein